MEENRTNMEPEAEYRGTARFDRIVFFNPVNKYTVASYTQAFDEDGEPLEFSEHLAQKIQAISLEEALEKLSVG